MSKAKVRPYAVRRLKMKQYAVRNGVGVRPQLIFVIEYSQSVLCLVLGHIHKAPEGNPKVKETFGTE